MSNTTITATADVIARYARKQFKRKAPKCPRIICYHCEHEIDEEPKDGITKRRIGHLVECDKFTYAPPGADQPDEERADTTNGVSRESDVEYDSNPNPGPIDDQ